jgi:hypothetical protein
VDRKKKPKRKKKKKKDPVAPAATTGGAGVVSDDGYAAALAEGLAACAACEPGAALESFERAHRTRPAEAVPPYNLACCHR